jgi:hypothetical protein
MGPWLPSQAPFSGDMWIEWDVRANYKYRLFLPGSCTSEANLN